jgi:glycosyltransferase involved in cell wall biosynthesis
MVFDFQGSLTGEMKDHKFLRQDSLFYRPLRWLEEQIDRLSPVILTSSDNARQMLLSECRCLPEKVHTLADCVNTETFQPAHENEQSALAKRRAALRIPKDRKIVVYLGLLADYQGTDALIHAAAHLLKRRQDVHFLIMGFPAVDYYQRMAQRLGIANHTTFTGKIPYQQARHFLALGDVAVAPKLSSTEGSGKILNYMAMGLPTVAFDTPVSREYLRDLGIYAKPGNALSLAEALLSALSEPMNSQRRLKLRRAALQDYSWDHAARTILHAYDAVCHPQQTMI